jgi:methionyl-tRNA formyltransferase
MRVVFLGTPEFAIPSLKSLVRSGHDVVGVFTQPDRPKGRGNRLSELPVKIAALELGLAVHQPERIRRPDIVNQLRSLNAELMVVVGYGQIIPQTIIDLPRYGILNVHASLLPKYRGAAPIQWAIANGETETGVTIMQIDAGLDTGDMLLKAAVSIGPDETAPELGARIAPLGAQLLSQTIDQLQTGRISREKQNDAEATYAPMLKKEDGRIDWHRPATQIYNRLRGFTPWPGAYTSFRGQALHIVEAKPVQKPASLSRTGEPGLLRMEKRRLFAECGENSELELLELQPAGKRRMRADAFLNGHNVSANEKLGEQN